MKGSINVKKLVYILLTGFMLGVLLLGCGKLTIPGEDGTKTKIDLKGIKDGNMDITVEDSDGEQSNMNLAVDEENVSFSQSSGDTEIISDFGEAAELPDDFPGDFPFPESAKLTGVQTVTDDGRRTHMIHFEFDQELKSVQDIYKEYAESKGYTIGFEQKMEDAYMISAGEEDGIAFSANIGYVDGAVGMVSYGFPVD